MTQLLGEYLGNTIQVVVIQAKHYFLGQEMQYDGAKASDAETSI
jgi:hypothetical protein